MFIHALSGQAWVCMIHLLLGVTINLIYFGSSISQNSLGGVDSFCSPTLIGVPYNQMRHEILTENRAAPGKPKRQCLCFDFKAFVPIWWKTHERNNGKKFIISVNYFVSHATFERFGSLCCSRNLNGSEFISIYFVLLCALLENLEMSCNLVGGGSWFLLEAISS